MSPAQTLDHYAEMLRIAEQQADLAEGGQLEALAGLDSRFSELAATLPAEPPAAAAAMLTRAALISQRTQEQLAAMQRALMQDVAVAAKASRAAHSYALQSRHARRIDHCA
ncbi:MAG: hypothetical protein WB698_09005 [Solirubrobacteraceae bacterium]